MVIKGVERYAATQGVSRITPEVMQAVREQAEMRYGRRFSFREFFRRSAAGLVPMSPSLGEREGGER